MKREINLANAATDPEFSEWKWATLEEDFEQAVDYKRPIHEKFKRTFRPYLDKKKKPRSRAYKRMQYSRRFVTVVVGKIA
ncbi:nudix hydrolase 25-like [Olea europaea subsp. europaea]|uniref:40S ribosomal protein S30 n=1 Tax=Olea europaea subsp. europaea TaxID=158383 RepID=A0A8S0VHD7_OLEEU|nr:nudix hydrolase 25-like [Olea europaea subsp. europaea]